MVGAPWIHSRMIRSCACGFMVHKALARVQGIGHEPPLRMVGPCGCGFMVGAPWIHSRMIRSCEAMAQLPPSAVQYCTVLDHGSRIKDQGSRTLDLVLAWMIILEGIRTWYQDHPNLLSKIYHFIEVLQRSNQGSSILDLVLAWTAILDGIQTWYQDCPILLSIFYQFL